MPLSPALPLYGLQEVDVYGGLASESSGTDRGESHGSRGLRGSMDLPLFSPHAAASSAGAPLSDYPNSPTYEDHLDDAPYARSNASDRDTAHHPDRPPQHDFPDAHPDSFASAADQYLDYENYSTRSPVDAIDRTANYI